MFDTETPAFLPTNRLENHLVYSENGSSIVRVMVDGVVTVENGRLTQARTQSVKEYLEKKGVEANRMIAKGYGETRPVCQQKNETCWEKNRRVEFVILKPAPADGGSSSGSAAPAPSTPAKKGEKKRK
jgi:hypothetical protein